jgi:hypothetical protein
MARVETFVDNKGMRAARGHRFVWNLRLGS